MKMKNTSFCLLLLTILNTHAEILKIRSFDEAIPVLDAAHKKTIVLFDVDGVITLPGCKMIWPQIMAQHNDG